MINNELTKDKIIIIQNLSIELTQRCNLKCAHCLKGECQNVDISEQTLDNIFKQVRLVNSLFLSGGEPMLAKQSLKYLINKLKEYKILVYAWDMNTNGTIYDEEVIELLKQLDKICEANTSKSINGTIAISDDKYHQQALLKSGLTNCLKYTINTHKIKNTPWYMGKNKLVPELFNEGRAEQLKDTSKILFKPMKYHAAIEDKYLMIGPAIHINANGLITHCDVSYSNQETKYNLGNINKQLLIDCIANNIGDIFDNFNDYYNRIEQEYSTYQDANNFEKVYTK
jgi:MoaA/NifB/PqqE/SkfB family radical SAM enzyme